MLYIFHGNLQAEIQKKCVGISCLKYFSDQDVKTRTSSLDIQRHVLESRPEITELGKKSTTMKHIVTVKPDLNNSVIISHGKVNKTCFLPPLWSNRTFHSLESHVFVYSAYLDERYTVPVVRIMSVLALDAGNRVLKVFCHFKTINGSLLMKEAKFYELCENHGKTFGGFILSCDIPNIIPTSDVSHINISLKVKPVHRKYQVPETKYVILQVTRLEKQTFLEMPSEPTVTTHKENNSTQDYLLSSRQTFYNYTICVPPLFGAVDVSRFVEFIELNRVLGFQHFIIYVMDIKNQDMINILDHYKNLGIISIIYWKLPEVIQKNKIWYNGQLTVHNDCLYRSMSMSKYLAIMDIDEFMVPHNGQKLLTAAIEPIMNATVCGLSFHSAFYDKRYSEKTADNQLDSKLFVVRHNGRSAMLSKVRTKVLIEPSKIFEVGIHHVSKPAHEKYQVIPVDKSIAFLHHYRNCVPNFGMKCTSSVVDTSMLNYSDELSLRVDNILKSVL